jgi:hypothetical protein
VTTTVTKLTVRVIESGPQAGVGVVTVVLLIVLLIHSQFLQTVGGPYGVGRRRVFQIAITPLMLAFVVVIITRLAENLNSS